ncbi:uridine phosphorylase [Lagierella sp.]|uniref:uridine phosphorylase n=1 Tax=Lagierella sp. TaxID=2849657 RepID=UPI002639D375|nr:uridine phosphorylase [Lagierella sp.]
MTREILGEEQFHIKLRKGDIGEYVLLPGDPKRSKLIAQYFENPVLVADNREYCIYNGFLDGVKVTVCSTGIGGPSTAIAVEELVNIGAKTLIRVGTCGGMDLDVKSGDVVIATGAIRMDGTSREYAPIEYPAVSDFDICDSLVRASKLLDFSYHVGVVQSKDSFYGQHSPETKPVSSELENKWKAWLRLGCLASEMESSTLFIVSSYRKVKAGGVFVCINNQERQKQGLENSLYEDVDRAIKVGIEAIKIQIEKDKKCD